MLIKVIRNASNKILVRLLLFFIVVDLAGITVMRMAADHISSLTQGKLKILDLRQMYSMEDVYLLFDTITEEGRLFYVNVFQSIDLIYPFIYAGMYVIILILLLRTVPLKQKKLTYLAYLPILGFTFDVSENIFIRILINNYPARIPMIVKLASLMTFLKWITMAAIVLIIVMLLIRLAYHFYKNHKAL